MIISLVLISLSAYLIWKASHSFDLAASYLTRNLNEGIKGPTINAIASSLPELLISFFFLFYIGDIKGFSAGFATIIGSSIFNIAMIPTISFIFIYYKKGTKRFPTDKSIIEQDGLFLIITEVALLIGLYYGGISIVLSSILILLYILYIGFVFYKRGNQSDSVSKDSGFEYDYTDDSFIQKVLKVDIAGLVLSNKSISKTNSISILIISLVIISLACKQLVSSSEHLSEQIGLNIFFVTFFIAAIASSIPDTILSIKDASNEKYKDSFSNAYGSNIFDICIGIGLPVLVYLLINGTEDIEVKSDNIILISSILLITFTIPITLIYWLKPINFFRSLFIMLLYIVFLTIVFLLT
ncbi:MAG: sodium:calcium antiporter [Flavobacteriales bacterium]